MNIEPEESTENTAFSVLFLFTREKKLPERENRSANKKVNKPAKIPLVPLAQGMDGQKGGHLSCVSRRLALTKL